MNRLKDASKEYNKWENKYKSERDEVFKFIFGKKSVYDKKEEPPTNTDLYYQGDFLDEDITEPIRALGASSQTRAKIIKANSQSSTSGNGGQTSIKYTTGLYPIGQSLDEHDDDAPNDMYGYYDGVYHSDY
jgi:hypothetical protein